MKALVFGVNPEPVPSRTTDNPLCRCWRRRRCGSWRSTIPGSCGPTGSCAAPRLTGICGSDSKQVFMDWGEFSADNPMIDFTSFPHILGHEVVADVVALGPEAEGLEVGTACVLNPWLSCAPRGVTPLCPACEAGDLSLCWNFQGAPIAPGIHSGTSKDASGGYATLMPAHDSMLFPVPDSIPDEVAVFADPFAVSLHAVTRHAPPPDSKVLVYGAGALGSCTVAILRALHPDVEVGVVARFESQAELARKLGARAGVRTRTADGPDRGSRGVVGWRAARAPRAADGVPGRDRCRVRHDLAARVARGLVPGAEGAGHDREGGRARADAVGVDTALLQGDLLGRAPTCSASRRSKACASTASRTTSISCSRAASISGRCSRTSSRSMIWRDAFGVLADQDGSGAIKVGLRP